MNRALPLILFAVLAAGGLAFFALSDGGSPGGPKPEDTTNTAGRDAKSPEPIVPKATETADLATTVAATRKAKPATNGQAKFLEIIPMNDLGQALAEAVVVAEGEGQRLEGVGRVKWEDLDAGEWTVTVTADELPTWERTLLIGNGEKRREPARMSEKLRVAGQVVDSYGEPLGKRQIYFLPKGKTHPQRTDIGTRRDKNQKPVTGPTNGAVAVTTLANGKFKVTLPHAGEWRLSVGRPGNADWTQPKGTELTVGGPDQLYAVVPAQSRLTFATDAPTDQRPIQVSAYVYDAQYAARTEFERQEQLRLDRAKVDMKNERRRMRAEAMDDLAKGGGKLDRNLRDEASPNSKMGLSQKELNERAYDANMAEFEAKQGGGRRRDALRAQPFDVGWRPVASGRFDLDGVAVLNNLPSGEDVQFLFVRGRERITTSTSSRLQKGVRSTGTVELPRSDGEAESVVTRRGEARVQVRVDEVADQGRLEPGVAWTVDG